MSLIYNENRQHPHVCVVPLVDTDGNYVLEDGDVLASVPVGAIFKSGFILVKTAFAAGTLDLGDADDPDRYTTAPVSLTATGLTALISTNATRYDEPTEIIGTVVGTPTAGVGEAYLVFEYVIDGVGHYIKEQ